MGGGGGGGANHIPSRAEKGDQSARTSVLYHIYRKSPETYPKI